MQITLNRELRAKFDAGLQITGEDSDGDLQWMGNDQQFQRAEQLEEEQAYKQKEINKDWRDYERDLIDLDEFNNSNNL